MRIYPIQSIDQTPANQAAFAVARPSRAAPRRASRAAPRRASRAAPKRAAPKRAAAKRGGKFVKGSAAAKRHMAKLRRMRKR